MSFHMGSLVGRIAEETPTYSLVKEYSSFQVRHYAPRLVSQFTYYPDRGEGTDLAFRTLARYIGVFATPENTAQGAPAKVAMTAPVVMGSAPQKVAMTAPVVMSSATPTLSQAPVLEAKELTEEERAHRGVQVMQFNLPRSFTKETAPQPTNPRVEIVEVPARYVASVTFSGRFNQQAIDERGRQLLAAVGREGLRPVGGYYCAGFNPPWTPPMLKTNEVYVDVEEEEWMGRSRVDAEPNVEGQSLLAQSA
eukprot:EG_transcript_16414